MDVAIFFPVIQLKNDENTGKMERKSFSSELSMKIEPFSVKWVPINFYLKTNIKTHNI